MSRSGIYPPVTLGQQVRLRDPLVQGPPSALAPSVTLGYSGGEVGGAQLGRSDFVRPTYDPIDDVDESALLGSLGVPDPLDTVDETLLLASLSRAPAPLGIGGAAGAAMEKGAATMVADGARNLQAGLTTVTALPSLLVPQMATQIQDARVLPLGGGPETGLPISSAAIGGAAATLTPAQVADSQRIARGQAAAQPQGFSAWLGQVADEYGAAADAVDARTRPLLQSPMTRFTYDAVSSVPPMAAGLTTRLAGGPVGTAAGLLTTFMTEGGNTTQTIYKDLRAKGVDEEAALIQAFSVGAPAGVVKSALEQGIGVETLANRILTPAARAAGASDGAIRNALTTWAGSSAGEAVTEPLQGTVDRAARFGTTGQGPAPFSDQAISEMGREALLGGTVGGIVGAPVVAGAVAADTARARQAAAMRQTPQPVRGSTPETPAPAGDTIPANPQESGVSSPSPAPATPNVAAATPDVARSPETVARIEFLFDELSNRPDMPDAERNAMEAEYAQLTGDTEYEAATQPGSVESAPATVAAVEPGAVVGGGGVAAPAVGTAADGQLPGVGQQLGSGDRRVGRVDTDGRVLAPDVSTGLVSGGTDANASGVAGSGGVLPARAAETMLPNVADMSGAELRARARELGVDDRGPISAVRRRMADFSSRQSPATETQAFAESLGEPAAPAQPLAAAEPASTVQTVPPSTLQDSGPFARPAESPRSTTGANGFSAAPGATTQSRPETPRTPQTPQVAQGSASPNPTPTRGPRRGPAPSAPVPPTPAQAPAPAPAQPPATSQQSPTRGESATAASGTVSAVALDENRSTVDADLADFSRQLGAPVTRAEPTTPMQRKMVERLGKLGRNVVFVNDGSEKFNGVVSNRDARTVYIRADADQKTAVSTLAHELLHSIVAEDAGFANRIAEIAGDSMVAAKTKKYRDNFAFRFGEQSREVQRFDRDTNLQREEGLAQFLEDAAEGDLEAARLLYETPGLLARLRQLLNDALERIGIARATPERRALNAMFDRIGVNGERAQQRSVAWAQSKGGTTMEVRRRFAKTPEYEMGVNARDVATMQTDDWSGSMERMFSFPGDTLPPDIARALEGAPLAVRRLFQTGVPNGRGPDAFAMLGEDAYMAVARAEAGLDDRGGQIEALRDNPDPENQYVAAVAQAARETGRNTTKVPIAANALQPGDVFRVNGKPVRVLRDENERMVLVGRPFRGILVEGLATIPIDTGTHYREGSRGNVQTVQEMGSEAADVPSESGGIEPTADVPFSPRSMFDRTDDAKGTGSDQGSLFGIPANARATTAPKLTLAERRELYPGIKPNETVADYEKRMGTADTPMMFSPLAPTIDVDGVQRPTTNSDGKPIARDEASVRNFWRWFADSEIVDSRGRPRVVYHGTDADFWTFDVNAKSSTGIKSKAFYFSADKQVASGYGDRVLAVYLRAQDAATFDFAGRSSVEFDGDSLSPSQLANKIASVNRSLADQTFDNESSLRDDLELAGWVYGRESVDGVVLENVVDSFGMGGAPATNFIVFDRSQVKSASDNAGTFDPANPDIRFAPGRGMSRIEQRNQERADRVIASLEKKVDTTAAKGEERAGEVAARMAKRVESEREKAESAKAAARATISVLQTQLRAAGAREKGLTKVVGILETMRARQEARADEATAENQARAAAMKQMRETQREVEQVKDELVRIVRDALPKSMHGAFITDIQKVRSRSQLPSITAKIEAASLDAQARELDDRMKRVTGVSNTSKLTDPATLLRIVGDKGNRGKLRKLSGVDGARDAARYAIENYVQSAKGFMDAKDTATKKLRLAELENALTRLTTIVQEQRVADRLIEAGRARSLSDAVAALAGRLAAMPVRTGLRRLTRTYGQAGMNAIVKLADAETLMTMMDGKIQGGDFYNRIYTPLREAMNRQFEIVDTMMTKADAHARRAGFADLADAEVRLFGLAGDANAITYKLPVAIGGLKEIPASQALKLYAMDQETLADTMNDRPWKWDDDGQEYTISWQQYDALVKAIPAEHRALVDALKSDRDTLFPSFARTVKILTGTEPPKVFGYDVRRVSPRWIAMNKPAEPIQTGPTGHIAASLENVGMGKARESTKAPLLATNFYADWKQSVDIQSRVIELAMPIRNAKMMIRNQRVADALTTKIHPSVTERLERMLDDVAGVNQKDPGIGNRIWATLGRNVGKSLTQLNVQSWLRNLGGIATLAPEMPAGVFADGVKGMFSTKFGDMLEESAFLRRMYGQNVYALKSIQAYEGSTPDARGPGAVGTATRGLRIAGRSTGSAAVNLWKTASGTPGAWQNAMEDMHTAMKAGGSITDGIGVMHWFASLPARIAYAGWKAEAARQGQSNDWALTQMEQSLRRTQGMNDALMLNGLQSQFRGTFYQPFLMFTNDSVRMANMAMRATMSGDNTYRAKVAGGIAMSAAIGSVVTAVLGREGLKAIFGDDEEDKNAKAAAEAAAWTFARDTLGIIAPGFSDRAVEAVRAIVAPTRGVTATDSALGNPVVSMFGGAVDAIAQLSRGAGELVEGDNRKGNTGGENVAGGAERLATSILRLYGSPLPSVVSQARRVGAVTE